MNALRHTLRVATESCLCTVSWKTYVCNSLSGRHCRGVLYRYKACRPIRRIVGNPFSYRLIIGADSLNRRLNRRIVGNPFSYRLIIGADSLNRRLTEYHLGLSLSSSRDSTQFVSRIWKLLTKCWHLAYRMTTILCGPILLVERSIWPILHANKHNWVIWISSVRLHNLMLFSTGLKTYTG